MTSWTGDELDQIGHADELRISSYRKDGTPRAFVTIWAVRVGESIYVRSAHGPENPWFVRALRSGAGRIEAGGVGRDVSFTAANAAEQNAIDTAYHQKYDRYGQRIVASVVGEKAHALTLRLTPTSSTQGEAS
ncbi:DUF2255 family protein [Rathayibacter soli]|uniref:DUF2255 family protein n=1 Tax=Rathayibacter soli TaxID=3144168 RepID=UPI0027E4FE58|nr:DUF2255 family protein [Glaciibacter superstes]